MLSHLRPALLAACLAVIAADAGAGRLDPALEEKLRNAAPGETVAVIVEMKDQAQPAAILSGMRKAPRKARMKALVAALREHADRGQLALKTELAKEQALGTVQGTRAFWIFNGLALTAREPLIRRLAARDDVLEVRMDARIPPPPRPASTGPASGTAEWNITVIRAPEVWAYDPPAGGPSGPFDGTGTVVGSFDTGVDVSHPDLSPRYRGNDAISWFDPYRQHSSPYDFHGHGTHTTGTAVGGDAGGSHIGVAPGAKWIAAKAWSDSGDGTTSAFHQIFEWFLAPGGDPENAPDVVINSWAVLDSGCFKEFLPDIQAWRAAGIFPAFAAGNSGPASGSVRSPGAYAEAFAVGATDMVDEVASFSSRGPSPCGGFTKPDISAPGVNVRSSIPGGYGVLSGTSMATPHLAGAVAVLRSIQPALTVDDLADILVLGAADIATPGSDNTSGAGRLDLFVSGEIAFHSTDTPLVRVVATQPVATEAGPTPGTLTFTRTGNTDAALEVKLEVSGTATPGSDYVPIPATIIIPAGAASATLAVTPIDDTLPEANETVSVTIVSDAAYIVSGTRVATVMIVSDELLPDLIATTLSAPASAGAGQSITLTDTTKNQGGSAAAASTTRYFLSSNTSFDTGDLALADRAVPALAAGASSSGSTAVTIPAQTAPGTWYLLAVVDATDAVPEDKESNNTISCSILIGADLTVSVLSVLDEVGPGQSIVITDTTANVGGGSAPASQTRYYLSTNGFYESGDIALGSRDIPALQPGTSSTGSVTVVIPAGTAVGSWFIVARADATGAVPETSETNNTRSSWIRIGPDLDVLSFAAPPTAGAGQTVLVTDTTTNQGGGTAPESVTQFYISSYIYLNSAAVALGGRTVAPLGRDATSTATTTITLPSDLSSGTWYLMAKADGPNAVDETYEDNNVSVRTISVGPDLKATSLSAPATAGAGQSITASDVTSNAGGGAAQASVTRYFLSADSVLDGTDQPLGERSVPALAAGASNSGSAALVIPAGIASGNYYLIAQADATGLVNETVESNNAVTRQITIGADLTITVASPPSGAGAGQNMTVTDTTRNQGGMTAGASTTRIYLSADATLDAGDVLIGSRSVPALPAGASSSGSTVATIPADTATGTWWVLTVADGAGVVTETSETNNVYARSIGIGPDLILYALTVPTAAGAGEAMSITDTTRNQGGGAAAATGTAYYLSSDSALDTNDVLLGSRAIPALASGVSNSGSTVVTVPLNTPAGTWFVVGKADGASALAETSESNNVIARMLRIGSDLTVSGVNAPTAAGAGQSMTVSDTTVNLGSSEPDPSQTQYFLSLNSTFQPTDILLGTRAVPALSAGASSTGSLQVTIPPDVATGKWYLLAVADAPGTIDESIETNNVTSRLIYVGPDLSVPAFTVPTAAVAGQSLTISDTTRNEGGEGTSASVTRFYLSANGVLDGADTFLGERQVPALAAGASSTVSTQLVIPATTAPGRWYVIGVADGLNALVESNETNNTSVRYIDISAP